MGTNIKEINMSDNLNNEYVCEKKKMLQQWIKLSHLPLYCTCLFYGMSRDTFLLALHTIRKLKKRN